MSANEMVSIILSFIIPITIMNLLFFGLGLSMEPIRYKRVGKKDKVRKDDRESDNKEEDTSNKEDLDIREKNLNELYRQLRVDIDEHLEDVAQQKESLDKREKLLDEREAELSKEDRIDDADKEDIKEEDTKDKDTE